MNASCCRSARSDRRAGRWASLGRLGEVTGWLGSGAMLVLMPKCPVCVAAYVALLTGLGISVSTAVHLRTATILLCLATFALLAGWRLRRIAAAKFPAR